MAKENDFRPLFMLWKQIDLECESLLKVTKKIRTKVAQFVGLISFEPRISSKAFQAFSTPSPQVKVTYL